MSLNSTPQSYEKNRKYKPGGLINFAEKTKWEAGRGVKMD